MVRTRHILAVTLVATALAADRAVASVSCAPAELSRPISVESMAGRLVRPLSSNFRRVIPSARLWENLRENAIVPSTVPDVQPPMVPIAPVAISPFQFRLPPPTC